MGHRTARGRTRDNPRMTGADGVSVLPAAMVAALVAGGIAISRSLRKSRAATHRTVTPRTAAGRKAAPAGHRVPAPGRAVSSGQTAVRATVDDDGR